MNGEFGVKFQKHTDARDEVARGFLQCAGRTVKYNLKDV